MITKEELQTMILNLQKTPRTAKEDLQARIILSLKETPMVTTKEDLQTRIILSLEETPMVTSKKDLQTRIMISLKKSPMVTKEDLQTRIMVSLKKSLVVKKKTHRDIRAIDMNLPTSVRNHQLLQFPQSQRM